MRALILALALLPLPALAQDFPDMQNLPYLSELDVGGGKLWTETQPADGYDVKQLMFNGAPVEGIRESYVDIQAVMPVPETDGEEMIFVTVAGGGNACPTLWAIVVISDDGVRATEPFGTCSEAIVDLRLTEGAQVAFDMAPITENGTWMTYQFDGYHISEFAQPDMP